MDTRYAIEPELAKAMVADYVTIRDAGMLGVLGREVQLAINAYHGPAPTMHSPMSECDAWNARREALDQHLRGDYFAPIRQIEGDAEHLAKLLQCDSHELLPYLITEMVDTPTTRAIVVQEMRRMADGLRKQATARRRSA